MKLAQDFMASHKVNASPPKANDMENVGAWQEMNVLQTNNWTSTLFPKSHGLAWQETNIALCARRRGCLTINKPYRDSSGHFFLLRCSSNWYCDGGSFFSMVGERGKTDTTSKFNSCVSSHFRPHTYRTAVWVGVLTEYTCTWEKLENLGWLV